jgi:hypothetical protein
MSYNNNIKEAWKELAGATTDAEAQIADLKSKLQDYELANATVQIEDMKNKLDEWKMGLKTGLDYAKVEQDLVAKMAEAPGVTFPPPGFLKSKKMEQMFADSIDEPMPQPVLKKMMPPLQEEVLPPMDEATARFMYKREEEMLVFYPRKQTGAEGYGPDQTCAIEPIRHFNVKDLLARFFVETHARYGEVANWRANCIGTTSMYVGGAKMSSHMPIFDYDGKNIKTQIRKDVKALQDQWELGDAWIYETRRGFHVYFFTDAVSWRSYQEMLNSTHCCKGFRRAGIERGYSVLRISAKYTEFDINFLYVLAAKAGQLRRMPRKAHMIRALLALGTQCGTHFASMFPQWAHFQQDPKEWKAPPPDPTKGKKIRKVANKQGLINAEPQLQVNPVDVNVFGNQGVKYVYAQPNSGTSAGTTASITWTTSNTWTVGENNQ